ncbi:MAG: DUF3551 domain-containing protein [Pseudomonadota bacterium]
MKKYALMFATASLLAAPALVTSATRAEAIQYPVCLSYVEGWSGVVERCEYTTMQQCQMSASGLNGSCYDNWRYAYAQPVPVERPVKRRYRRDY